MGWRDKPLQNNNEKNELSEKEQNELTLAALEEGFRKQGIPEDQIQVMLKAQRDFVEQKNSGQPIDLEITKTDHAPIVPLGDKYGKKKWVPDLDFIERLAEAGLTEAMIAAKCGIRYDFFVRKKEEYPEMELVIQRAYANKIIEPVFKAAMHSATKLHNPLMIQYLLNAVGKFDDGKGKRQVEMNVTGEVKTTHVFVAPQMMEGPEFQAMLAKQRAKPHVEIATSLDDDVDAEVIDE